MQRRSSFARASARFAAAFAPFTPFAATSAAFDAASVSGVFTLPFAARASFAAHAMWRPRERAWIGRAMESRDVQRLREDLELGVRLAGSLGLDVSDVELPFT